MSSRLDGLERYPVRTRHDAEHYIRVLAANIHPVMFARVTAELFPVIPVAMTAMREVEANNIDEIATWIETNAADASLRDEAVQLRADAMQLRCRETPPSSHDECAAARSDQR